MDDREFLRQVEALRKLVEEHQAELLEMAKAARLIDQEAGNESMDGAPHYFTTTLDRRTVPVLYLDFEDRVELDEEALQDQFDRGAMA